MPTEFERNMYFHLFPDTLRVGLPLADVQFAHSDVDLLIVRFIFDWCFPVNTTHHYLINAFTEKQRCLGRNMGERTL